MLQILPADLYARRIINRSTENITDKSEPITIHTLHNLFDTKKVIATLHILFDKSEPITIHTLHILFDMKKVIPTLKSLLDIEKIIFTLHNLFDMKKVICTLKNLFDQLELFTIHTLHNLFDMKKLGWGGVGWGCRENEFHNIEMQRNSKTINKTETLTLIGPFFHPLALP